MIVLVHGKKPGEVYADVYCKGIDGIVGCDALLRITADDVRYYDAEQSVFKLNSDGYLWIRCPDCGAATQLSAHNCPHELIERATKTLSETDADMVRKAFLAKPARCVIER